VWFTRLSGAGKTTIGREVQQRLSGCAVELFDADIIRTHLCKDLGWKTSAPSKIRRIHLTTESSTDCQQRITPVDR
jgi:adenylylsulfate kinase-like enzyme